MSVTYKDFLWFWQIMNMKNTVLFLFFVVAITNASVLKSNEKLGVVVDAGSSGSRVHLYSWLSQNSIEEKMPSCKSNQALTNYEGKESDSATEIIDCLNTKEPFISYKEARPQTKFFLGATAGMRMLSLRNAVSSENIFKNIRKQVKTLHFLTEEKGENIRIISGAEEGYCAWVTVNYLNGYFKNPSSQQSIGALDLGGASTQISFSATSSNKLLMYDIRVFNKPYSVFSYSLLCYGRNQMHYRYLAMLLKDNAFKDTVDSPCGMMSDQLTIAEDLIFSAPCISGTYAKSTFGEEIIPPSKTGKNFIFNGKTNYDDCRNYVLKMLNTDAVKKVQSNMPPLTGKFYGFSSFYYTAKGLNLPQSTTKSNFIDEVKKMCNTMMTPAQLDDQKRWLCLDGIYQVELLSAYGFNDNNWQTLEFVKKVNQTEVNWALGFMINHMGSSDSSSMVHFSFSTFLFYFFPIVMAIPSC